MCTLTICPHKMLAPCRAMLHYTPSRHAVPHYTTHPRAMPCHATLHTLAPCRAMLCYTPSRHTVPHSRAHSHAHTHTHPVLAPHPPPHHHHPSPAHNRDYRRQLALATRLLALRAHPIPGKRAHAQHLLLGLSRKKHRADSHLVVARAQAAGSSNERSWRPSFLQGLPPVSGFQSRKKQGRFRGAPDDERSTCCRTWATRGVAQLA